MDQILKLFTNSDQVLIAVAIALILLGIITPKKFVGFEVDWTAAKSASVLFIGMCLLGFSLWHTFNHEPARSAATPSFDRDANVPARNPGPGN